MIISYGDMQDALKNYEKALSWNKAALYWITQEPEYIRELRIIAGHKSKSAEALSAADLVRFAAVVIESPAIRKYFSKWENLETNYFLKSAQLLYKAKYLNEESLPLLMNEYARHPKSALVCILDKLSDNLLSESNLTVLFKFANFFDYDKGPLLFENSICQAHIDSIFAICTVYSSDIHKVREMLELYAMSNKTPASSYDVLFSRGVAAVANPNEQKSSDEIVFSRAVTPVTRPLKAKTRSVNDIKENAVMHGLG